ncbi:MAG TPA: glycosyl hydrolase 108 family protein [Syntrophorhabdaceae bacterium]
MASYMDIINATMQYQKTSLERRGGHGQGTQGISFETILSQSMDPWKIEGTVSPAVSQSPISPAELEDELKFKECLKFVLGQEGNKFVSDDGGKESSRYGILQSTAKYLGYKGDVKNITRPEVEKLYKKIWDKSGAKGLDLPMALVHFDTFVNSPASARKLLKKSEGNLENYIKSREQRYTRLAEARPEAYGKYLKGWKNRINSLKNVVAQYNKQNIMAAAGAYGVRGSGKLA